jgi:activating signal cointegrator complex subunit 2
MEEVPGIPSGVPPLATYPSPNVRSSLSSIEWEGCLDSWLFSLEYRLRLQDQQFQKFKFSQEASGVHFLASLYRSVLDGVPGSSSSVAQKERLLLKRAYLLLRRLLLVTQVPFDYDNANLVDVLSHASRVYHAVGDWKTTLSALWKRNKVQLSSAVESWQKTALTDLNSQLESPKLLDTYKRVNSFVKVSSDVGLVLMTGSDYLESLMEAYDRTQSIPDPAPLQKVLTEHIFYCFRSLMSDGSRHGSMLLDHLYHMKSESERLAKVQPHRRTLCSSLICTTSLLRHLAADDAINAGKRGQGVLDFLTSYRQHNIHLHPPLTPRRRKVSKGKGKASATEEMHIHKASQISQVHELFPSLSNRYIIDLLDHFSDDTEAVIAALLEPGSLPIDLRNPEANQGQSVSYDGPAHDLAPHSTPSLLPQRKNVFDGDDFDNLRISASQLHKGRKAVKVDQPQDADTHARSKAAIMAALAAFDSDDDERDDTYDVADVGGTVDSTVDTDSRPRPEKASEQDSHEESLFRAWKANEEIFSRDSKTRVSKVRQDLKRETGMSDEQIEGWAIMLRKDTRLQESLEKKYSASRAYVGNQTALATSRWQAETPEDSEEGEATNDSRRMGQAQIRGNRTWGRGRGGSTAGPAGDTSTQAARRRKEQGKGRGGASHNRREGRARKMGRGMAGPPAQ